MPIHSYAAIPMEKRKLRDQQLHVLIFTNHHTTCTKGVRVCLLPRPPYRVLCSLCFTLMSPCIVCSPEEATLCFVEFLLLCSFFLQEKKGQGFFFTPHEANDK